jgi:hypothetical protein
MIDAAGRAQSAVIDLTSTWVRVLRRWRTCRSDQGRVIGPSGAWVLSRRRQVLLAVITTRTLGPDSAPVRLMSLLR